jgi:hypothetical protein
MNLRSQAAVAGAVTLITLAICFFGVRSELGRGHRPTNQSLPEVAQLNRSEADRFCAQRFADGC